NLMLGDCLERMKEIPDGSVDMILADPPYGTTACKWDSIIQLEPMWEQLKRIIKPNGAIVMTASQPFTTTLIASNIQGYKHQWFWNKNNSAGFATAKVRPFAICEDVLVFSKNGEKVNYYPQMTTGKMRIKGGYSKSDNYRITPTSKLCDKYYPKNLLNFSNASQKGKVHPTQKPVALMEYLIKTYTNENETVLDFTFGSGSTGVACMNTNRKFIGIEMDDHYFDIGSKRILESNKDE
ncbi:MAG TPA: site-specific DNA-methyltransferase, partial [Chitinophagales bacterium]|nr:site-specific DNA-methyltransferase [Chitinophagales bacterium]